MNSMMQPHPAAAAATPSDDRSVTTLALLIRKTGISTALFSRYWRDVHGVLAARIPGFESYIQYHLDAPLDDLLPEEVNRASKVRATARFDGLAEVTFKNADKRLGLATSDVTAMIRSISYALTCCCRANSNHGKPRAWTTSRRRTRRSTPSFNSTSRARPRAKASGRR